MSTAATREAFPRMFPSVSSPRMLSLDLMLSLTMSSIQPSFMCALSQLHHLSPSLETISAILVLSEGINGELILEHYIIAVPT